MLYISTRGTDSAGPQQFCDILLEGLASNGGLFVPEEYPKLLRRDLESLRHASYEEVALSVLRLFITDIPFETLREIIAKSYGNGLFGSAQVTPVRELGREIFLLKLSEGPTLAFKDLALQPLAHLMQYVLKQNNDELNILGATSGDTGSAAAYAVKGKKRLRLFMLSPYGRMSRFQQRQMYTLDEPNIFNLVVNGTFDDCQAIVKEVNADAEFKKKYKLGAVNSINWARIAAQVVYYVYGYLRVAKDVAQYVTFAVPSGNFGNALSAYIAREMGLPISIVVCTNENDVLDEFFRTGKYRVRASADVATTSSPSMDIASASNFERFMFEYVGRDPACIRELWNELKQNGEFNVHEAEPGVCSNILSGKSTDEEVLETIRKVYGASGVIIDPHTAVAMKVGLEHRRQADDTLVVTETAQPAKFADTIREALGLEVQVPTKYKGLEELPEHTTRIDPDPEAVKQFIVEHVQ